ncbi:unnamed protein product [Schistocephalus solidus]|uniref:Cyclic nucleotide-binding domain-containing protein n=1 Tax=Schistocephalus solidus TaxID=70667 RepID=A0A183SFC7_SCHSO|nr:unnamed protein product [Schistocephalus solidus]
MVIGLRSSKRCFANGFLTEVNSCKESFGKQIMQIFPEEMRGDIALHINREILSLPIFKSASIGCQMSIAQLIGTRFSTPGEFLVHRGDAIRYLHFVCSGSLEILDEEGSVVALLGMSQIIL